MGCNCSQNNTNNNNEVIEKTVIKKIQNGIKTIMIVDDLNRLWKQSMQKNKVDGK